MSKDDRVLVPADPNHRVATITSDPWPSFGTELGRVRIDWDDGHSHRWAYWNLEQLIPEGETE